MNLKRSWTFMAAASFAVAAVGPAFAEDWNAGAGKDWDALLAAGRKEGSVVVSLCPALTESIGKAFKADTGIDISFVTGSVADLGTKFDTEIKSGRVQTDARLSGTSTLPYVTQGVLVPLADKLMLPNVTNASDWLSGKLGWLDKDQTYLPVPADYVGGWPLINTQFVDAKSITTWQDLLKPEFKGKIAALDPLDPIGSSTSLYLAHLFGVDFVGQLYKGQNVTLTTDRAQLVNWAARGTYPIVIGADAAPEIETYKQAGITTLQALSMTDGPGNLIGGCSVLTVPAKSPHPNAALVFANWFLSKNGQAAYVAGQNQPTDRLDVSNANVAASLLPKPGLQYFSSYRQDYVLNERPALLTQIGKIMGR